jgi:hypothetical protein
MRKLLCTLATLLAVTGTPAVQAAVIDFDMAGVIEIDNDTNRATFKEDGFSLMGDAAGFLPIDFVGSGMSGGLVLFAGNAVSLSADDGGLFNFLGLDAGRSESASPATLTLTGIFGNSREISTMLALGDLASLQLLDWTGLRELRLAADADLVIDNVQVSQVPEPDTVAMLLLGMGALVVLRTRRPGRAIRTRRAQVRTR